MSKPYSEDLRERVVPAVEGGRRQVASVFEVGVSTVVRWMQRLRATGSLAAKPMAATTACCWQESGIGFWSASRRSPI